MESHRKIATPRTGRRWRLRYLSTSDGGGRVCCNIPNHPCAPAWARDCTPRGSSSLYARHNTSTKIATILGDWSSGHIRGRPILWYISSRHQCCDSWEPDRATSRRFPHHQSSCAADAKYELADKSSIVGHETVASLLYLIFRDIPGMSSSLHFDSSWQAQEHSSVGTGPYSQLNAAAGRRQTRLIRRKEAVALAPHHDRCARSIPSFGALHAKRLAPCAAAPVNAEALPSARTSSTDPSLADINSLLYPEDHVQMHA